jgi:hypothetical protein
VSRRLAIPAFLLGSVALLLASLPPLDTLTKPLSGLGLLLGLLSLRAARGLVPAAASAVCLLTFLGAGPWPLGRREAPADPSLLTVVPDRDKGMTRRATLGGDEWWDASRGALQQRDVRVRVTSAAVGSVPTRTDSRRGSSARKYLVIRVRVRNVGAFRVVDFETWADPLLVPGRHNPSLTDDSGRPYSRVTFSPRATAGGHAGLAHLTPGKFVDDALVFPVPPLGQVEYLRLELPASAFGGSGTLRLQIPRSMIKAT